MPAMSARHRPPYLVDADTSPVVALRLHTADDVARVLEQCVDPLSRRWTTVPLDYTVEQAGRFVSEAVPGGWEDGTEWGFAVDVDGRFGGTVSLRPEHGGRVEVAYGAHPDVRGTGAMERALRLLLEWGFAEQGVRTVVWRAERGNWASRRLAWRLGFAITATPVRSYLEHRGELVDMWVGTLLAGDDRRPATPWLEAPRIASPRLPLRLRELRESDVPRIVEACQDPETVRWLGRLPAPYGPAQALGSLGRRREEAAAGRGLALAGVDADDLLLGTVEINDIDLSHPSGTVGYWVHPDARGRGVATEMARLALRHALLPAPDGGLGLARVLADAAVANTASRRVLEKAGMREVGTMARGTRTREGLVDAALYELT